MKYRPRLFNTISILQKWWAFCTIVELTVFWCNQRGRHLHHSSCSLFQEFWKAYHYQVPTKPRHIWCLHQRQNALLGSHPQEEAGIWNLWTELPPRGTPIQSYQKIVQVIYVTFWASTRLQRWMVGNTKIATTFRAETLRSQAAGSLWKSARLWSQQW